jgi:iron complex transport system ATP-binding protein
VTAIALETVSVRYEGRAVLRDVTMRVGPGEWLCLIGPNGAGKTSLLKAVAGLVAFDGTVRVNGDDPGAGPANRRRRARQVALVPQRPSIPEAMTVASYVLMGRTPYIPYFGVESPRDLAVVDEVLVRMELRDLAARPLGELSGGELQRAILARALAQEAPVLLLDEPTSSLDIGHQHQVLELVDALRRERGLTIVSAMHDLTLAAQFADRLVLLSEGHVVADGDPREVLTEEVLGRHYPGASVKVLEDGGDIVVVPVRTDRTTAAPRS